jgi:hypothetical protein
MQKYKIHSVDTVKRIVYTGFRNRIGNSRRDRSMASGESVQKIIKSTDYPILVHHSYKMASNDTIHDSHHRVKL